MHNHKHINYVAKASLISIMRRNNGKREIHYDYCEVNEIKTFIITAVSLTNKTEKLTHQVGVIIMMAILHII